jgi:ABC-2 type transport system ATP-binding protein
LTKCYGGTVAVENLSFTVSYGRIVGFLGPNGAGKTTTLRALLGLVKPTGGTATIDGLPYEDLADPVRSVGALLDGKAVHPGRSGRDHLRVLARAADVADERVEELLNLVDLESVADKRAGTYSLGMFQRLGLAVALLGDPRVLVLDEPANGLDPYGVRWLRDLLCSFAAAGRAILMSSHVLAEVAQSADDVVVIREGHLVLEESLERLLAARANGVRVAGPDSAQLGELLSAKGAQIVSAESGAIVIVNCTEEEVLHAIAARQLVVSEVSRVGSTLEEIYLDLTGDRLGDSL